MTVNPPEVRLKLILEIDDLEDVIDSIDFSDVIEDLFRENAEFTMEQVRGYVLENNPHIKFDV